jgi:gluconokinase
VGGALADAPGFVVACSALTRRYRDRLRNCAPDLRCVELIVPREVLDLRMRGRAHFMPPSLLGSQIATLEHLEPDEAGVRIDNEGTVDEVAERAALALRDQSLR